MPQVINRIQMLLRRIHRWLMRDAVEPTTDNLPPNNPASAERFTPPADWQQQTRHAPPAHWLKLVDDHPGEEMMYQPGQAITPLSPAESDSRSPRSPAIPPAQEVSHTLRPVRPGHTQQPDTIQPDRQTASPVHPIHPAPGRRSVIHPLRPVQATRPKPSKRVTSHTPDTPRSRVPHVKPAVDNPSSLTETTPAYPVDTAPVSSVNPAIRQASTVRQIPSSENRSAARAPMTSQPNQAPSEPLQTHPATHPADRDPLATYRARMQQRLTQQPPPRTPAQPDTPPPVPRIMPSHTAHNRPRFITPDTHPAESNPPQHPAYDAPNDPSVTRASDANTAHHRPDYHTAPHNRPHPVSQTNAQRQAVDAPRTRQTSHTHPPAVSQRGTSHRSTATAPLSMQNGRWPLLIAEDNSSVVHRIQGDDTASDDAHPYDIHPTHKRDTSWNV